MASNHQSALSTMTSKVDSVPLGVHTAHPAAALVRPHSPGRLPARRGPARMGGHHQPHRGIVLRRLLYSSRLHPRHSGWCHSPWCPSAARRPAGVSRAAARGVRLQSDRWRGRSFADRDPRTARLGNGCCRSRDRPQASRSVTCPLDTDRSVCDLRCAFMAHGLPWPCVFLLGAAWVEITREKGVIQRPRSV
jgi:hypothetical protein